MNKPFEISTMEGGVSTKTTQIPSSANDEISNMENPEPRGGRGTQAGPDLGPAVQKIQEEKANSESLIRRALEIDEKNFDREVDKMREARSAFIDDINNLNERLTVATGNERKRLQALSSQAKDHLHLLDKVFPQESFSVARDHDVLRNIVRKFKEYEGARRRQTTANIKLNEGKGSVGDVNRTQAEAYALQKEVSMLARQGEIILSRDESERALNEGISMTHEQEEEEDRFLEARKVARGIYNHNSENETMQKNMDMLAVKSYDNDMSEKLGEQPIIQVETLAKDGLPQQELVDLPILTEIVGESVGTVAQVEQATPGPQPVAQEISLETETASEEISPEQIAIVQEVKAEFESLSPEEKKEVSIGLTNVGLLVGEWTNRRFSNLLNSARSKDNGTVDRWLQSLSEDRGRSADEKLKSMEAPASAIGEGLKVTSVAGNIIKYGRVFTDIFGPTLASPLRYFMLGGMLFGKGAEISKEARFKNEEVLEKTRVQDIDEAAEEAWKIYEEAIAGKGSISKEDLDQAYLDKIPEDLMKRLKSDPEPGTASSILQKILNKQVGASIGRINMEVERIENDATLDDFGKKVERQKLFLKYEKHLIDLDRAVSQFGIVDELALGAKYAESAAHLAVKGMMIETVVLSIDKLWEKMPSIMHGASEWLSEQPIITVTTPANLEEVTSFVATAEKGDSRWSLIKSGLADGPFKDKWDGMSEEQRTYVTDVIKDRLTSGMTAEEANTLNVGDKIDFSDIFNDKSFMDDAFSGAQKINPEEIERIKDYAPETLTSDASMEAPVKDVLLADFEQPIGDEQQSNSVIETLGMRGNFEYSSSGAIEKFAIQGTANAVDAEKNLNPNWNKVILSNSSSVNAELGATSVRLNAMTVYEYQKMLEVLEEKGSGESPEAEFLRDNIKEIVANTETRYGDVFKNIETFSDKPITDLINEGLAPEQVSPTSTIPAEILPENITEQARFEGIAKGVLTRDMNRLFGEIGFLGIGHVNGVDTIHWKDPDVGFGNKTVSEILVAHPSAITPEGGRTFGIENERATQQMKDYIKSVQYLSQTDPYEGEKLTDYVHRASMAKLATQ